VGRDAGLPEVDAAGAVTDQQIRLGVEGVERGQYRFAFPEREEARDVGDREGVMALAYSITTPSRIATAAETARSSPSSGVRNA